MAKYILLDTETTGNTKEDRIIQLGYIVLGGANIEVHNELFSTDIPIKLEAMEVHNITPDMIENKQKIEDSQSYKRLLELNNEDNFIIIHNASFDLGMLKKEGFENKMQLIDTLRCAKHLYPDIPYHRLQYLRYLFGLYNQEQEEAKKLNVEIKAHDAIGDVLILKLLLTNIKKEVLNQFNGVDPVLKMVELTKTPVLLKFMRFGKYQGKTFEEIKQVEKKYLSWLINNIDDLDEDLRYTIEYWLK